MERGKEYRVARFKRKALKELAFYHGKPETREHTGFLGLDAESMRAMSVSIGEIIDVTRNNIDSSFKAKVVRGENGYVAITGVLRRALGLDARDENNRLNGKVALQADGDEIIITLL